MEQMQIIQTANTQMHTQQQHTHGEKNMNQKLNSIL